MISEDQRTRIIRQFNCFANRYDQDNYLSGLIIVSNVQRRRPRVGEENAKLHNKSYSYKIRMIGDDTSYRCVEKLLYPYMVSLEEDFNFFRNH